MNNLNNFNMIPEEEYLDRMEPYYIKKNTPESQQIFHQNGFATCFFVAKIERKTNFTAKIQAIK